MNHHDRGGLHHVSADELQRFPGSLVNAPQLLLLLVGDPQPVLEHREAKWMTLVEQGKAQEGGADFTLYLCHELRGLLQNIPSSPHPTDSIQSSTSGQPTLQ